MTPNAGRDLLEGRLASGSIEPRGVAALLAHQESEERESDCAAWKRWAGVATSDESLCELLLVVDAVGVVVVDVVVEEGVARSGVHWLQSES